MKKIENQINRSDKEAVEADVVDRGVKIIRDQGLNKLSPVLIRLLAEGKPVNVKELAFKVGWPEKKIRKHLSIHSSVEYDDQDRFSKNV